MITMYKLNNLFTQTAVELRDRALYEKIFQQQSLRFDLTTYKISNMSSQIMTKIYDNIWKKYTVTQQLSENQNNWQQNQRRVFVWFIICYTHLKRYENFDQNKLVHDEAFWKELSQVFFNKNPELLQFQYLNMMKSKKRQNWTDAEDKHLLEALEMEEEGRWNQISKRMFFNSNRQCFRTPKQCRQRWLNHLDKTKKRGGWSTTEDYTIFKYIMENGKHWSKIVPYLNNTRTQHMIKNRYNSVISKLINSQNRKQQEALIITINRLEKEINKETDVSSSEEKLEQKKTETHMTVEEEQYKEKESLEVLIPEPRLESVKAYENTPILYYTYFMDANSNIFLSPIISPTYPQINIYASGMSCLDFKLSSDSSFTAYNSQAFA